MSFTYRGHDLPLSTYIDRDMSRIELIDPRGDVVEAFHLNDRAEAEALRDRVNADFERCVREIATNSRAGHPAEKLSFPGTTTEEICRSLDYIWTCGGDGYPREIITPLFEADLIYIEQPNHTARLTEHAVRAWEAWDAKCSEAGHRGQY